MGERTSLSTGGERGPKEEKEEGGKEACGTKGPLSAYKEKEKTV